MLNTLVLDHQRGLVDLEREENIIIFIMVGGKTLESNITCEKKQISGSSFVFY